jgi:hypothetical protein
VTTREHELITTFRWSFGNCKAIDGSCDIDLIYLCHSDLHMTRVQISFAQSISTASPSNGCDLSREIGEIVRGTQTDLGLANDHVTPLTARRTSLLTESDCASSIRSARPSQDVSQTSVTWVLGVTCRWRSPVLTPRCEALKWVGFPFHVFYECMTKYGEEGVGNQSVCWGYPTRIH